MRILKKQCGGGKHMLEVGKAAPDFVCLNQDDVEMKLADFAGKKVVLYFYPRDNTPGCTIEANDFKANTEAFEALNTVVIGVSKDSVKSHTNFICKHELPFNLLSDKELEVIKAYDVWQLKKNYGKESMGVVRSTFLIDEEGILREAWTKVKVKGHVEAVLVAIKAL